MPMTARERSALRIGIVLAFVIAAFMLWGKPALDEQRVRGERFDNCFANYNPGPPRLACLEAIDK